MATRRDPVDPCVPTPPPTTSAHRVPGESRTGAEAMSVSLLEVIDNSLGVLALLVGILFIRHRNDDE